MCPLTLLVNFTTCVVRKMENKSHEVSSLPSSSNAQKKERIPWKHKY